MLDSQPTNAAPSAQYESFLAAGRNLRSRGRQVDLFISSPGFGGQYRHFLLSPHRDRVAAKHFLQLALGRVRHLRPRVINVDGHPAYPSVIAELKQTGQLPKYCRCRRSRYLNNLIEQDHRFLKKRIVASQGFRSVEGALHTIQGYEAVHMIRKGQIRWLRNGDTVGQLRFVNRLFGIAA